MTILATALLSAAITCALLFGVGYQLFIRYLQPVLEQEVEQRLEELGVLIEARVREGVVNGVNDITHPGNLQRQMTKGSDTLINALFGIGRSDRS